MHQGEDFQMDGHEIGPWTEPEPYMELSPNRHLTDLFQYSLPVSLFFFLGMTSALSVCIGSVTRFCIVCDV